MVLWFKTLITLAKKKRVVLQLNISMLFMIGSKNPCDLSCYRADDGSTSERKNRREKGSLDGGQRKATNIKLLFSPPLWYKSIQRKK